MSSSNSTIYKQIQATNVLRHELETLKSGRKVYLQQPGSLVFFKSDKDTALKNCQQNLQSLQRQHEELQNKMDLTIIACVTLSCKYQDSPSPAVDYELIAQCYSIDDVQLIQNAEIELLEYFEYDICVTTPDHFFSYLINLTTDDVKSKQIIEQARSVFFTNFLSNERADLFYNYPSSIVTLSFIYNIASNKTFIVEQMKSFLVHKKDPSHYFKQLLLCTDLLQSCNIING
ncbi:unnamed protein product [Rotaria socialis]